MSDQVVSAVGNLEAAVRGLMIAMQKSLGDYTKAYEARTKEIAKANMLIANLTDGGKTFPLYVIVHGEELGEDGMLEAEEDAAGQAGQAPKTGGR